MIDISTASIQSAMACILLIMGTHLIGGAIPKELKASCYDSSRKLMGIAMLIFPITTSVYYGTRICQLSHDYATALNITSFSIISTIIVSSLTTFIGEKIKTTSARGIMILISTTLYPMMAWVAILAEDGTATLFIHIVTITLIISQTIYQAICLISSCIAAKEHKCNKLGDNNELELKHTNKCMVVIGIYAIASIIASFSMRMNMPKWWQILFLVHTIATFVYIYELYISYMVNYNSQKVKVAIPLQSTEDVEVEIAHKPEEYKPEAYNTQCRLSKDNHQIISTRLEEWIKEKKYTTQGLTITSMASDILSNRTYLSAYINSTYKCTFKVWLTTLRLDEAKRILLLDENLTVNEIAEMSGFASSTSFAHVFKETEGISPLKWRKINKY